MYGGFRKIWALVLIAAATVFMMVPYQGKTVHAAEPIVVVIDPGHGGENLGTDYLPIPEKVYTMQVALYMKQELEKYKNVVEVNA